MGGYMDGLSLGDLVEVVDSGNGRVKQWEGRQGRISELDTMMDCVTVYLYDTSEFVKLHAAYVKKVKEKL